jgi:hypothetical protein
MKKTYRARIRQFGFWVIFWIVIIIAFEFGTPRVLLDTSYSGSVCAFYDGSIIDMIKTVKEGLAELLEIDIKQIRLVKLEGVMWLNSALGYPEPDKFYLQVIIYGWRITLKVEDKEYEVHTGMGQAKVKIEDKIYAFPIVVKEIDP